MMSQTRSTARNGYMLCRMSTALLTKISFQSKTVGTLGVAAAAAAESRITHWREICSLLLMGRVRLPPMTRPSVEVSVLLVT